MKFLNSGVLFGARVWREDRVELRKSELSNDWPGRGQARSGATANSLGRRYVTLRYSSIIPRE